jgi:microcystin-dependent protein
MLDRYYDKAGVDSLLERYYDKTGVDSLLEQYYDKGGVDFLLEQYYDKGEIDSLILTKLDKVIPKGIIVMWSGRVTDIPAGWALCDGNSGTPNLTDKFICGTNADLELIDKEGGNNDLVLTLDHLPNHNHAVGNLTVNNAGNHNHYNDPPGTYTSVDGAHSHKHDIDDANGAGDQVTLGNGPASDYVGSVEGSHQHYVDVPVFNSAEGGTHSHSISGATGMAGGNVAFNNRPAYYKLGFIIKL